MTLLRKNEVCSVILACGVFLVAEDRLNAQIQVDRLPVKITSSATATSQEVERGVLDPSRQPAVFYHGKDWFIDLVDRSTESEPLKLSERSPDGTSFLVTLDEEYAQVDGIYKASNNQAIIVAELNGDSSAFSVLDLTTGKIIDDIGGYDIVLSPNHRFVLYANWFLPRGDVDSTHRYHIYDVLKDQKANICGYASNDPQHTERAEDLLGFQVYPQDPGQTVCSDDIEDGSSGFDFVWSADSTKVLFADSDDDGMTLVLVKMPAGTDANPITLIYPLKGAENPCVDEKESCDYYNVKSLALTDKGVKADLIAAPTKLTERAIHLDLPFDRFKPITVKTPTKVRQPVVESDTN